MRAENHNKIKIQAAQKELDSLVQTLKEVQSVERGNMSLVTSLQSRIAALQGRIANLQSEDALSRRFSVLDEPIPPPHPFEPKKKLIVALALVTGLFLGVFLVFFGRFLHSAKERRLERQESPD